MLDTVKINHVQHISFTQSRLTDAVSVILSELLSYEHPSYERGAFFSSKAGESTGSASEQAEDQDGVPLQVQHPAPESDVVVF